MSRSRGSALAIVVACVGMLAGCSSGNPGSGSPAYKQGELGNGGFLFQCDDSVACDRWSTNDAKDFPDQIASGSTFDVRFVANGEKGVSLIPNGSAYSGVTGEPVAPYVSVGPDGFLAKEPGWGTIIVRNSTGFIVDYVTVHIVKPKKLAVYAAEYKGSNPTYLERVELKISDRKGLRTVATTEQLEPIAGSLRFQWEVVDSSVATIESTSRGVVNLVAKKEGTTKLRAVGAAVEKEIELEVKP